MQIPPIKVKYIDGAGKIYILIYVHSADFVRKEYALALKLRKNIVPVAHEEFDWPDRSRLPKDCDSVMGLNAVK